MRFELALIVGIVFFCCWCAYIIVKMNSSVTIASDHPKQQAIPNSGHNNYLYYDPNDHINNNNNYPLNQQHQLYRYNNNNLSSSLLPTRTPTELWANQTNSKSNSNIRVPISASATVKAGQVASPYYYSDRILTRSPSYNSAQDVNNLEPRNRILLQPNIRPSPPYLSEQANIWSTSNQQPQQHVAAASQNWRDYSSILAAPQSFLIEKNNNPWRAQNGVSVQHQQPRSPYFVYSNSPSTVNHQRMPINNQQFTVADRWQPSVIHNNNYKSTPPAPILQQFNSPMPTTLSESRQSNEEESDENDEDSNTTTAQAQDSNPDPDGESSTDNGQESATSESDQAETATDPEEVPRVNRELEEQTGQRSFSEDQTDANERDRNGNIIVTHRRHLINGKPVNDKSINTNRADSSSRDFDKISGEIDENSNQAADDYDDGAEPPASNDGGQSNQQQQEESRQRGVVQKLNSHSQEGASKGLINLERPMTGLNGTLFRKILEPQPKITTRPLAGKKKSKPKNQKSVKPTDNVESKTSTTDSNLNEDDMEEIDENSKDVLPKGAKDRESHEHRMKETLTAQQWDDDSGNSPQATKIKAQQDEQEQEQANADGGGENTDTSNTKEERDDSNSSQSEEPNEGQEEPEETGPMQSDEELKELDMNVEPEKFMQSERRKRQVDLVETNGTFILPKDIADPVDKHTTVSASESMLPLIALKNDTLSTHNNVTVPLIGDETTSNEQQLVPPPIFNNDQTQSNEVAHIMGDEMSSVVNPMIATELLPPDNNDNPTTVLDQATYNHFYDSMNLQNQQNIAPPIEVGDLMRNNGDQQQQQQQQHQGTAADSAINNSQLPYKPPLVDQNNHHQQFYDQSSNNNNNNYTNNQQDYPLDYHSTGIESNANMMNQPLVGTSTIASNLEHNYPLQASSSKSKKKKLKKKKFKKSKISEAKYKAAKAIAMKKKSKSRKGGGNKKKKKAKKKFAKTYKEFSGKKEGKKKAKGGGQQGGNKGALYYKDKGYKKRGFKKAYQKLETGDHKTYFDEFRDKDHNKKWKNFKDKHNYSQKKQWVGKDDKKYKNMNLNELKKKKYGMWKDKTATKYKKATKSGNTGIKYIKKKKLKKKTKKKKSDFEFE